MYAPYAADYTRRHAVLCRTGRSGKDGNGSVSLDELDPEARAPCVPRLPVEGKREGNYSPRLSCVRNHGGAGAISRRRWSRTRVLCSNPFTSRAATSCCQLILPTPPCRCG